jgi:hypothetical protein
MAILDFDGTKFMKASLGAVMMGFPMAGLLPVGILGLMHTFSAMRTYNRFGTVGQVFLGFLGLAGAHVIAALSLVSFDPSKPKEPSLGLFFLEWIVLYGIGMFVLYRNDKIKED